MFNYQGRVKIEGRNYNGQGQFKFAILSPDMKSTLWSNDASSVDGSQPATGIPLSVSDGVFNLIMGSETQMEPINATIFQNREPLKLRTWFNDGVHGFEQLNPDYNLINTALISSETGSDDFTIFVNHDIGDDSNSGLKATEAKKTIQAAIEIIPSRVRSNVTVDIADGTYEEEVMLYGINVRPGKRVTLKGDETFSSVSLNLPKVKINAKPTSNSAFANCLIAEQCTNIYIEGIAFTNAREAGALFENGKYTVSNCVAEANGKEGFWFDGSAKGQLNFVTARNNGSHGIAFTSQSRGFADSPVAKNNGRNGIFLVDSSTLSMYTTCQLNSNTENGIHIIGNSQVGVPNDFSGQIRFNKGYGMAAIWNSYFHNVTGHIDYSSNVTANTFEAKNGQVFW